MPKISKVRIVNFSYNDGNRLIADELFDFSNQEQNDALNVLINLANGGGKSVLVQLLMQPLLPKAKVANRRIESFFSAPTDHYFVVLEWIKDNSTEKLITGISMAARQSLSTDEENTRGMTVKYYTFYAEYGDESSPYTIANLPLSRKEHGRFLPAAFNDVKEQAKKSRNALCCYNAEDALPWQRKLAEFGLVQEEWRMIEQLNSEEGGLGKYFGNFKNSDALVEKLLIPTIERKLDAGSVQEDSSLSTMLLSYVNQCLKNKDVLKEKQTYEAFLHQMEQLKPQVEQLREADRHAAEALCALFGLADAFAAEQTALAAAQEAAAQQSAELEQQEKHIRWEKDSAEYHLRQEALQAAEEAFRAAAQAWQDRAGESHAAEHALKATECAGYYQKQQELESSMESLRKEIHIQETGGDRAAELASLKYSAFCAAQEEAAAGQPRLEALRTQQKETAAQKQQAEADRAAAEKKQNTLLAALNKAQGRLEAEQNETDRGVEKLGEALQRRLDGAYPAEELEAIAAAQTAQHARQEAALAQIEAQLAENKARRDALPEEKATVRYHMREEEHSITQLEEQLEAYHKQEDALRPIFQQYSLDFSRRFSDSLTRFLQDAQRQNTAEQQAIYRKIEILREGIAAADRGSVHVPDAVIQYLNATGVPYTTCEKYLQDQMEAGKLDAARCLEILETYPAAAYGILMDEKAHAELLEQGREQWLPALVPIFHHAEMARILNGEEAFSGAIAFYSEEYFADKEHYRANMAHQKALKEEERTRCEAQAAHLAGQLRLAEAFTYPADWAEAQGRQIQQHQQAVQAAQDKLQALEQQAAALAAAGEALSRDKSACEEKLRTLRQKLERIDGIRARIQREDALRNQIAAQQTELDAARQAFAAAAAAVAQLQQLAQEQADSIRDLNTQLRTVQDALQQLGDCDPAPRIEGVWQDLFRQYQQLQQSANQAIDQLRQRLQDKQNQWNEYAGELRKRELPQQDYAALVYSPETEADLRRQCKVCLVAEETAQECKNDAKDRRTEAKVHFQNAEKSIQAYGSVLEKAQIGTDFAARIHAIAQEKQRLEAENRQRQNRTMQLARKQDQLTDALSGYDRPEEVPAVALEPDFARQLLSMQNTLKAQQAARSGMRSAVEESLTAMAERFGGETGGTADAVTGMQEILAGKKPGDRYYTLSLCVDGHMENAARAIAKIQTDLAEFENRRSDLVQQCTLQGERIYKGLRQMEASSSVSVYPGRPRQRMIRFDMPAEVDPAVAMAAITEEMDLGVEQLLADRENNEPDIVLKKHADTIVGSVSLLHKYIGRDSIPVQAYKIDRTPQNSRYRTWEKTQVNNSGAEKFVVYFAVILSLINYTRGSLNMLQEKELYSTLILDNPFGATSSEHILTPMFAIAKHFRVQMICLSDINKSDVINCFDIVIKAIVKKRPLSASELLTHEGNEQIEHGYYRAEQISMLE